MFSNFTLQDVFGVFLAFSLFPFVIIFPGYVFGWFFNLFEFRSRFLFTRFTISLLLSVAISPILYYLTISWFSPTIALIVTLLVALVFAVLMLYEKLPSFQDGPWRALLLVIFGWMVLSTFSLVDLQLGDHELYFSVMSYDHTTRVSIIDAMTRTGVPPINPSYYPGHYVKLTFLYFFWYILGSIVDCMGGSLVNARTALFASILWCGLALMATISFYLRLRNGHDQTPIWRRAFIGIASLAITGLDILPSVVFLRTGDRMIGDLEHWNEQITAWAGSLLWVPHHVAGLIAGFVGVMLVHSACDKSRAGQFATLAFSGVAFASALGLSVWVTFVFVLFWAAWMSSLYFQKENRTLLPSMTFAGVVAILLAGPFLFGLWSGGGGGETGAFPVALTVRSFRMADVFFEEPSLWMYLIRLILLPINYFFELGFFAFAAIIWLKMNKTHLRKNPYYFAEILLLGASFCIGTFIRSTVIDNNDLGWRAWLPGQFVLLIWGVDVLERIFVSPQKKPTISPATKYNLVVLIALGFSTTVLDIFLLRFADQIALGSESGYRIFSARQAYTFIDQTQPKEVIIQYNPHEAINRPSGLYGMRQSVISDRTAYGVPLDQYEDEVDAVGKIFEMENVQHWASIDALCKVHGINLIVIVETDPLWESLDALKRERAPLYLDNYYAVFACGN